MAHSPAVFASSRRASWGLAFAPLFLDAADYVGSTACKGCHPAEYAIQSNSAHARALAKAEPERKGRGTPSLDQETPAAPVLRGVTEEWAFGAGGQAITYVSQIDADTYLEHGLSYYPSAKSKALTPGHSTTDGVKYRTFDPGSAILRCFQCHSTAAHRGRPAADLAPIMSPRRADAIASSILSV